VRFDKIEQRLASIEATLVEMPKTILKSVLEQLPKIIVQDVLAKLPKAVKKDRIHASGLTCQFKKRMRGRGAAHSDVTVTGMSLAPTAGRHFD